MVDHDPRSHISAAQRSMLSVMSESRALVFRAYGISMDQCMPCFLGVVDQVADSDAAMCELVRLVYAVAVVNRDVTAQAGGVLDELACQDTIDGGGRLERRLMALNMLTALSKSADAEFRELDDE